jgi:hypothetical protein
VTTRIGVPPGDTLHVLAGGAGGTGGGGGSSYVTPSAPSSSSTASTRTGDGQVVITYDPAADACPDTTDSTVDVRRPVTVRNTAPARSSLAGTLTIRSAAIPTIRDTVKYLTSRR